MFINRNNEISKTNNVISNYVPIDCKPQSYDDEVDDNERYRKKYIFIIYPLQKAIKDFIFESRDNLIQGKKAFKSSLKSYQTFLMFLYINQMTLPN